MYIIVTRKFCTKNSVQKINYRKFLSRENSVQRKFCTEKILSKKVQYRENSVRDILYMQDNCFSIAGIYPQASSKEVAHGSQSDYSRYPCAVVLTLDQKVVFSVVRITGVANLPQGCGSSSKRASASTYLGSLTGSWTRVQGAWSWCSSTELSTHPMQDNYILGKLCPAIILSRNPCPRTSSTWTVLSKENSVQYNFGQENSIQEYFA